MVLDVIIIKTNDGFTAEVPSISGCECWAHDEETVIGKIFDLTAFYLNLDTKKMKLDRARKENNGIVYKLVFDK